MFSSSGKFVARHWLLLMLAASPILLFESLGVPAEDQKFSPAMQVLIGLLVWCPYALAASFGFLARSKLSRTAVSAPVSLAASALVVTMGLFLSLIVKVGFFVEDYVPFSGVPLSMFVTFCLAALSLVAASRITRTNEKSA